MKSKLIRVIAGIAIVVANAFMGGFVSKQADLSGYMNLPPSRPGITMTLNENKQEDPSYQNLISEILEDTAEVIKEGTDDLKERRERDGKIENSRVRPSYTDSPPLNTNREAGPMKPIDVGKIRITPFEFVNILEVRIDKNLNEHATLYVRGLVEDMKETQPITESLEETKVKFENGGKVYFSGVLTKVNVTRAEYVFCLEIYAISNTVLLDVVKYKRSFQDNSETYESIVNRIIQDKSGSVTYNAPESKVENILLQYDETDWEFAKRLASHTQSVLIPIAASEKPAFHFGVPDKGQESLESSEFTMQKDFELYRRISKEKPDFTEKDAVSYIIKTDDILNYELGEKLSFNKESLYVRNAALSLVDGSMSCVYTLTAKAAVSVPKVYNRTIVGLSLDGTVMEAENDRVKLHLEIDKDKDNKLKSDITADANKAYLFSYATGYSAEGHTGWYVMPELDDTVQLLFPKEDEKYAFAAMSVRQKDTEKTADPLVKYLRTPFGKEIKLDEKEILITSKDDATFIRINEDTGIEIITPKPISISSGGTLDMFSQDDMTITTKKNLTITADESITMVNGKNNIKIQPSSGIGMSTNKEFKVNSDENGTIDSKKELLLKSGKDTTISSGMKLKESAQSGLELTCSGSSVKLDGNVDIKGMLIKEN